MSRDGGYYRPALKPTVDVQLQTAFSDGNWPVAIRLADKRAKTLNDPYYEVLKACAESQLDGPMERCAALVSIDDQVRKGIVPKEADALELYEWACCDVKGSFSYADTIGLLRSRWVKANPRSPAAPQCLRACIQNWDLVNAQQIAATLDKALQAPANRHYMYWSIMLTYLLSRSPQCSSDKQKIYRLLTQKQLERAAETAELAFSGGTVGSEAPKAPDRGLWTEEEVLFYYRVLAEHATPDEYSARMKSPALGALKQFDQGRKHLFHEAVSVFEAREQWDAVFGFCLHALSRKDDDGSASFLASDLSVWRRLIRAAGRLPNQENALAQIESLLADFVALIASGTASPMYAKNIGLALLDLTFVAPGTAEETLHPGPGSESMLRNPRLAQLCLFLERHGDKTSAFDDVSPYFERLQPEEAGELLREWIPALFAKNSSRLTEADLEPLVLKLNYSLINRTRCPLLSLHSAEYGIGLQNLGPAHSCHLCGPLSTPGRSPLCLSLHDIAERALKAHSRNIGINGHPASAVVSKDISFTLVAAMSLLKQSGLAGGSTRHPKLHSLRIPELLQTVLLLDVQVQRTPDDAPLRLLLTRLYLLLGCASLAQQVWLPLGVKRTIQDSLSPLFFDRISSVSPGLFASSRPLMEPLRSYYAHSLRDPSPVKIWDAFGAGSYSSILEMADYDDRLRRSCTLIMTVVEERRAARALDGRLDDLDSLSFLPDVYDDTVLVSTIDYGSVPSFETSSERSFAESLGIGPPPSNTRSHLGLLSEELLQLCSHAPPKDYKPSKPNDAVALDALYVTEMLASLHDSLTHFLHLPDTPARLTGPEFSYYTVLTSLTALLLESLTTSRTEPLPSTIMQLTSTIKAAMASLATALNAVPSAQATSLHSTAAPIFWQLTDPHTMSIYRDTGAALVQAVAFVLTYHEREQVRDRSGKSGLHKELVPQLKALDKLGSAALAAVRGRVQKLKIDLSAPVPQTGSWLDWILELTFGLEEHGVGLESLNHGQSKAILDSVGGRAAAEEWAGRIVDSWRDGIKGWGLVRTE